MKVYPNPVSDFVNVEINTTGNDFEYSISDVSGKIVKEGLVQKGINRLDIYDLEKGFYLIHVMLDPSAGIIKEALMRFIGSGFIVL